MMGLVHHEQRGPPVRLLQDFRPNTLLHEAKGGTHRIDPLADAIVAPTCPDRHLP